ncbi:MAG: hypothetical protein EOO71_00815 [Myxococcaceae bacterium]|nr:MAG: hypothetical protein EOO71_00815 [Myxococcaceae bacterium]
MSSRAIAPALLCASVLWPLRALACINSMDGSIPDFTSTFWVDLGLWTLGAVFLNRTVLVSVGGSTATTSAPRKAFLLLASAAIILMLSTFYAGAPLLSFSAYDLSYCSVSPVMLSALVASPALFFGLQAAYFHGPGRRMFGGWRRLALVSLMLTSVLLVVGLAVARQLFILPNLCQNPSFFDPYG